MFKNGADDIYDKAIKNYNIFSNQEFVTYVLTLRFLLCSIVCTVYTDTYHMRTHLDTEQLSVGMTHLCSMWGLNPHHVAKRTNRLALLTVLSNIYNVIKIR